MKNCQRKYCEICGQPFTPDPRVGNRQRVCKKLSCQQQRKHHAQQKWLAKNPGYFKDRYWYLKEWLTRHPGYLKSYRARKKAQQDKSLIDIQDELTSNKIRMLNPLQFLLDIQDEISNYFINWLTDSQLLPPVIYKTR